MHNPCSVINAKGEIVKNVFLSELAAWERNGYKYYDPNAPMPEFDKPLVLENKISTPKKPKKPTQPLIEVEENDSTQ